VTNKAQFRSGGSSKRTGGVASSRSFARGESFSKKLTHDFTGSPWRVPPGYNTNDGEESRQ